MKRFEVSYGIWSQLSQSAAPLKVSSVKVNAGDPREAEQVAVQQIKARDPHALDRASQPVVRVYTILEVN